MGIFDKLFGKKQTQNKNITSPVKIDPTPDIPLPFTHNNAWYAIKDETPQTVTEKLCLEIVCESNWKTGLEHIYYSDDVFVSPNLNGYIFVIGLIGMSRNADHDIVREHARLFNELLYFGNHSVADYYAWAKFKNGIVIRAYAYIGDGDELFWNEGEMTSEEIALGFDRFPKLPVSEDSTEDGADAAIPDESSIIDIAGAWSINHIFEESDYEKSTGYICKFNRRF